MKLLLLVLALQNPESLAIRFSGMTAITGYEQGMTDSLLALLPGSTRDRIGNVTLTLGRGAPRRLVYCALDEIGYVVGNITDDGYLLLRRVGGGLRLSPLFDQQLEGQRVTLFGRKAAVPGVVAVRSTHLTRGRPTRDEPPFTVDNAYVDIGAATLYWSGLRFFRRLSKRRGCAGEHQHQQQKELRQTRARVFLVKYFHRNLSRRIVVLKI